MAQWKLVNIETGKGGVNIGDELETSRGEKVKVVGFAPPHKPEASGKVFCENESHCDSVWYAGRGELPVCEGIDQSYNF